MTAALLTALALATAPPAPHAVIAPSEGAIPANALRIYLTFDRPERGRVSMKDVRLTDADGRPVVGAFMDFGQELWSPDGRRLTVLFDPGRVKRSVEGDGDSASPLQPGRSVTVEMASQRFHYQITPALRTPLDPQAWRLVVPGAGSRDPLNVVFDREIDTALLSDQLTIVDGHGRQQKGRAATAADGRSWCWLPTHVWRSGIYGLVIGGALEDISGNRVGEALDHDLGAVGGSDESRVLPIPVAAAAKPTALP